MIRPSQLVMLSRRAVEVRTRWRKSSSICRSCKATLPVTRSPFVLLRRGKRLRLSLRYCRWGVPSFMEISRWMLGVPPYGVDESGWNRWIMVNQGRGAHFLSKCYLFLYPVSMFQPPVSQIGAATTWDIYLENGHFTSALSSLGNVHGGWQAGIGTWNHVLGQLGCLNAKISLSSIILIVIPLFCHQ